MDEKQKINVTLLANEGILLQFQDVKIMIDGISKDESGAWSSISDHVYADLLAGEKPLFQKIDYVFYTHCHSDHFSAELTEKFLQKHRVKGLIMPDLETRGYGSLRRTAARQADEVWLLSLEFGQKKEIRLTDEISLTVFRSIHEGGAKNISIENYCYILNLNGRKVFIIADGEYNSEYFTRMLADESIETAFINPMFLNGADGRKVVLDSIKADRLIVYHIPFAEKDQMGFRNIVSHDVKKYRDILPPTDVLWDELQELTI